MLSTAAMGDGRVHALSWTGGGDYREGGGGGGWWEGEGKVEEVKNWQRRGGCRGGGGTGRSSGSGGVRTGWRLKSWAATEKKRENQINGLGGEVARCMFGLVGKGKIGGN